MIVASVNVSKVAVIQKSGRAVRVDSSTGKFHATIHDFAQYNNSIATKQTEKRVKIYKNTMGLPVEYK